MTAYENSRICFYLQSRKKIHVEFLTLEFKSVTQEDLIYLEFLRVK